MEKNEAIDCGHFDKAAWLLITGELDDGARSAWQHHVAGCRNCARLLAERRRVLDVYDGMVAPPDGTLDLLRFSVPTRRQRAWSQPVMGIAASLLLLIVGAVAGRATLHTEGSGDVLRDLHRRLNDLEVQLAVSRIDQPTAAERLKAAAVDVALPYRDARIVESLLDALEADPSPNVRMAVITTLYNIEDTARLRERFDTLLAAQALPMLQIALIELAADRRLVESVGALRRMATEPGDDAVRQRARWAISVLSPGA